MLYEIEICILKFKSLGLFPSEDVTAKVTIRGSLLENGVLELEILYNTAWPQVKVLLDNFHKFLG